MMATVSAVLVAALLVAALRLALAYARSVASNRRKYREHVEAFYQAVEPLLSKKETPQELLGVLRSLNGEISNPRASRRLSDFFLSGRQLEQTPETRRIIAEIQAFVRPRPLMQTAWRDTMSNWFLAVTYRSIFLGPILRAAMTNARLQDTASSVAARGGGRNDNPPTGGLAGAASAC